MTSFAPVAIIGAGCRFPGDANNLENFWKALWDRSSAKGPVPSSRWSINAQWHPDVERADTTVMSEGHFMKDDMANFDSSFFASTPKEAMGMDPQQRMLLEVSYEALENAGLAIKDIAGSSTACYIGSLSTEIAATTIHDPVAIGPHTMTGTTNTALASRLSWFYDFKGPSAMVDTACSSSMYAFHLGCQSIQSGESGMAIVGGSNLMMNSMTATTLSAGHILSPSGQSWSFDDRANGYGRGEGTGIVILKNLADAIRDGNTIRAIVRGSGCNQDGRTISMPVPCDKAQERLIRSVYQKAGLEPSLTGFVEAHATGTMVGDSVEMKSILRVFGKNRKRMFYVGSVKSILGHMEGAAGIASVIKCVLAVERGIIPPNLEFNQWNPRVEPDERIVKVPTRPVVWPAHYPTRQASVNSFGAGGSNGHIILQDVQSYLDERLLDGFHATIPSPQLISSRETPIPFSTSSNHEQMNSIPCTSEPASRLFVISSHDRDGVDRSINSLIPYLEKKLSSMSTQNQTSFFRALANTLSNHRTVFEWQQFFIASDFHDLIATLKKEPLLPIRLEQSHGLIFAFTGQGAQWFAMGRELLSAYPQFLKSIQKSDQILIDCGADWSLEEELCRSETESKVSTANIAQPACTALQIALVQLLKSFEIRPTAVVGHSSGEIAAAYCSGAISHTQAVKTAYYRGHCVAELYSKNPALAGGMVAVKASHETLQRLLDCISTGSAVIACINSASDYTVSGDATAITELEGILTSENLPFKRLNVRTAYHSLHMKHVRDAYFRAMSNLYDENACSSSLIPMFSSVTGHILDPEQINAQYWVENLASPVNFLGAVNSLIAHITRQRGNKNHDTSFLNLLEVGPHSALRWPLMDTIENHETLKDIGPRYDTLLIRGKEATATLLQAIGSLHTSGYSINWSAVNCVQPNSLVIDLPPYAWDHTNKLWGESPLAKAHRLRSYARHDLVGYPVPFSAFPRWRHVLKIRENPWILHHKVQGSILYPGSGLLIMAIEASRQLMSDLSLVYAFEITDFTIDAALKIPNEDASVEVAVELRPKIFAGKAPMNPIWEFEILSYNTDTEGWLGHCTGHIQLLLSTEFGVDMLNETAQEIQRLSHTLSTDKIYREASTEELYNAFEATGLQFGHLFRNLSDISCCEKFSRAVLSVPNTAEVMPCNFEYDYLIHPAALDTAFQLCVVPVFSSYSSQHLSDAFLPISARRVLIANSTSLKAAGKRFDGQSRCSRVGYGQHSSSVVVTTDGTSQIVIEDLEFKCLPRIEARATMSSTEHQLGLGFKWIRDLDYISDIDIERIVHERSSGPLDHDHKLSGESLFKKLEDYSKTYIKNLLDARRLRDKNTGMNGHLELWYEWLIAVTRDVGTQEERKQDIEAEIRRTKIGDVSLNMITAIGDNFDSIMDRSVEPLQLMARGGLWSSFYEILAGLSHDHALAEYAGLVSEKYADISILEIGAGTGGTTKNVLERLENNGGTAIRASSYTFTDIAPAFVANAIEHFRSKAYFSSMKFATLDIEKDPLSQGFQTGNYDLIIASNVLHATRSIANTLQNVAGLLKPGGKLLLAELLHAYVPFAFCMGSLPGWWVGENDGRRGGPLLSKSQWDMQLRNAGFTGVDMEIGSTLGGSEDSVSFLASTKSTTRSSQRKWDKVAIISNLGRGEPTDLGTALHNRLRAMGLQVARFTQKDSVSKGYVCISLLDEEESLYWQTPSRAFNHLRELWQTASAVIWVTRGGAFDSPNPFQNIVNGLARSARFENLQCSFVTLDLGLDTSNPDALDSIEAVFSRLQKGKQFEYEYAVHNGDLYIPRVNYSNLSSTFSEVRAGKSEKRVHLTSNERCFKLNIERPGRLDTLHFIESKEILAPLDPEDVEIEVKAVGLNFHDILTAMGQIKGSSFGLEASGRITRVGAKVTNFSVGQRVFACEGHRGLLATHARIHASLLLRIPDGMSFESAASLSVVFLTAQYSLITEARLQKGETVLIHSGAGGVGQAAIMVAQKIGADVFTTVGSEEKRRFVHNEYRIPHDHIFSSRNLSFEKGILRMTQGRGVDVVLNSLAGEALQSSWKCVAPFGRFVEIGKVDMLAKSGLNMEPFVKNRKFVGVELIDLLDAANPRARDILDRFQCSIDKNELSPVKPINVFQASECQQAFRLMQTGEHRGKIVIRFEGEESLQVSASLNHISLKEDASYLLVGGLGGLGRSLAIWLAENGAKNLVMLSRSAGSKPDNMNFVEHLKSSFGIEVFSMDCDISDRTALTETLDICQRRLPSIRGVIIGAVVIEDSMLETMTAEQFQKAYAPKVNGTWNLHELLPKDLDFFIMLSSISSIVGLKGQSNYNAGNAFQDALAHYRVNQGLKGTSINLPPVSGVGFVSRNSQLISFFKNIGIPIISPADVLDIIGVAITGHCPDGQKVPPQIIPALPTCQERDTWYWINDPKFSFLWNHGTGPTQIHKESQSVRESLSLATDLEAATTMIEKALVEKVAKQMLMNVEDVDVAKSLVLYGVDSLVAAEVRNWVAEEMQSEISVFEISSGISASKLAVQIARNSALLDEFREGS